MPRHQRLIVVPMILLTAFAQSRIAIGDEHRSATSSETREEAKTDCLLKLHVSWGHESAPGTRFQVSLKATDGRIEDLVAEGLEVDEVVRAGAVQSRAGGGDVDGLQFTLRFPNRQLAEISNPHTIWSRLLVDGDADTAQRLRLDPGFRPDGRKLTVLLDDEGTRGFSVTIDQLLRNGVMWVPDLDVFLSASQSPVAYLEHRKALAKWSGQRILDQVRRGSEASYEEFTRRWEDMGKPGYRNPAAPPPGHIVCVTWDSAIRKFGIDRGAGVRSDLGNPDRFRCWLDIGELNEESIPSWKGQNLTDGLPVITTRIERNGVLYEIEQFVYPLDGPPPKRVGDMPMALLQKVRLTTLQGKAAKQVIRLKFQLESAGNDTDLAVLANEMTVVAEETRTRDIALLLEASGQAFRSSTALGKKRKTQVVELALDLPAQGSRDFVIKLPSPPVPRAKRQVLMDLDYSSARAATLRYWSDYLARGARFEVPETGVNELFRASLWHALRLPRRHGDSGGHTAIDLPYSNFAYGQKGTPWPVNQAVYVDYMLYDLRGYHDLSAEELAAVFRNNQAATGEVSGFAHWGVYTPSMLYAVAQHYLLSGDRSGLVELLPPSLRALDWCLAQAKQVDRNPGPARGLLLAPLNDLTKEARAWAFNQAYLFAGLERFGRVLTEIGHPRAAECRAAAQSIRNAVEIGFKKATTMSPVVQLRDHTWSPYVPSDALTPRRLFEIWYPTDVDTGALHLSRLQALDPSGALTTFMLNDHEDNLFYRGWGMANEPVYNQQATAYLLRDEVKPAIRSFYSMMACAFSHSVFEPVEHRWGWGQYFGPPSTDGAWFELYRRMLIHERDDGSLLLLQATPRRWLEDGKRIVVERAPSYYGDVSMFVESHTGSGEIRATIGALARKTPTSLFVRLRHPQARPLKSVRVNGAIWTDFDAQRESVRIRRPDRKKYEIVSHY